MCISMFPGNPAAVAALLGQRFCKYRSVITDISGYSKSGQPLHYIGQFSPDRRQRTEKNFVMMAAALVLPASPCRSTTPKPSASAAWRFYRHAAPIGRPEQHAQQAAPRQATQPAAAGQAAQPKRSWMGPLAGLAAGLGLAALASHFGPCAKSCGQLHDDGLARHGGHRRDRLTSCARRLPPKATRGWQYAGAGAPLGGQCAAA